MDRNHTFIAPPIFSPAGLPRVTIAVVLISIVVGVLAPIAATALVARSLWDAPGEVRVSPAPGSRHVAPDTQIAFRGLAAERLRITVTGSESGFQIGIVRVDLDGQGARFLPDRPFVPGEIVTVRSAHRVHGATDGQFQYTIAAPPRDIPT